MVFGILVHSIENNTVYLSYFYNREGNDGNKPKRVEHIVSKVVSDIEFRVKCKQEMELDRRRIRGEQTQPENTKVTPVERGTALEGMFRVTQADLFPAPKIVVWREFQGIAWTVICEMDENRMLANHFLQSFPKLLLEHFKIQQLTVDLVLSKIEELLLLLQQTLPNGQLLFLSGNLAKHLRKEMDVK
jgi:hypothetical protein